MPSWPLARSVSNYTRTRLELNNYYKNNHQDGLFKHDMVRLQSLHRDVSETLSTATACLTDPRFKAVDDHQIKVDILLPPQLKAGIHPLIIAYHGGYLISGARDHYMFMASWLPAYAVSTSAIIVSPDHRLFPSASTSDILSDLEDLWQWIHTGLPDVLSFYAPEHEVDLNKILVEGNSAGGFCAAHLAIDHANSIRAAILVYPMVDCLSPYLTRGPPGDIAASAPFRGDVLSEKIRATRQEGWVSERRDQNGILLTLSTMKDGRFGEIFGTDEQHNPLHRVKKMEQILPRL